jgi:hypothetical protein
MIRALVLGLALAPSAVHACALGVKEFAIADLARDPIVVVGDVVAYAREGLDAELVLDVTETLKGEAPARVTVQWKGVLLGGIPPETWDGFPSRVVGGLEPGESESLQLVSRACNSAHLVEATDGTIADAKAALR